jgi:spermidine/putrescine transport system permease protein
MTANRLLSAYTWAFLIFMFGPLILMVISSVNDVSPPTVPEWHGLTGK